VLYTLLIYMDPNAGPAPDTPEAQADFERWMTFDEELRASGAVKSGEALQMPDTATTVRSENGEVVTTDGPIAETKEVLGGYHLIDAPDLDAALEWAGKMPNMGRGSVDVRPVMVFG